MDRAITPQSSTHTISHSNILPAEMGARTSKQPPILAEKTETLHEENWQTVSSAGSGTWCTASLLMRSMPPEQKQ